LLGRVRVPPVPRRLRSYSALRRLAFFGRRYGCPLLHGPPRPGRFFYIGRGCTLTHGASEILAQAPRWPVSARGRARLSQVTGSSSCHVPWSKTPPSALPSRPWSTASLLPSGSTIPWALGNLQFRGCTHTARVFVCLRIAGEHRCSLAQGSLPACRAQLWPDGFRTRWTTSRNFMNHRMSSFLSDQHCLVAPWTWSWSFSWPWPTVHTTTATYTTTTSCGYRGIAANRNSRQPAIPGAQSGCAADLVCFAA